MGARGRVRIRPRRVHRSKRQRAHYLGPTYFRFGLVANMFWVPPADLDTEYHELHAGYVFGKSAEAALAGLARARDTYLSHFNALGIGERVIRNLIDSHLPGEESFELSRAAF